MSKYAVLVLPFFIVSVISIEPLITNSSDGSIVNNNQISAVPAADSTTELLAQNSPVLKIQSNKQEEHKVVKVLITAYSSTPEETDDTPFITASGSYVREGIVAANFLPFGARIKIPEIFGDQVFVVEDRLHERHNDRIDVWFPTKEKALRFGIKISEIEILSS
jgi:3D (Asp-Asp-Asp) domain-containing protein